MILFLWLLLVVALIVWMTARGGVHPFLALLFGALAVGFLAGLDAVTIIGSITDGFGGTLQAIGIVIAARSEEHTSELQSRGHLVCRLLLEKKKQQKETEHGS